MIHDIQGVELEALQVRVDGHEVGQILEIDIGGGLTQDRSGTACTVPSAAASSVQAWAWAKTLIVLRVVVVDHVLAVVADPARPAWRWRSG